MTYHSSSWTSASRRNTSELEGSTPAEKVLGDPQDAYTRELLTAIPQPPLPVH